MHHVLCWAVGVLVLRGGAKRRTCGAAGTRADKEMGGAHDMAEARGERKVD